MVARSQSRQRSSKINYSPDIYSHDSLPPPWMRNFWKGLFFFGIWAPDRTIRITNNQKLALCVPWGNGLGDDCPLFDSSKFAVSIWRVLCRRGKRLNAFVQYDNVAPSLHQGHKVVCTMCDLSRSFCHTRRGNGVRQNYRIGLPWSVGIFAGAWYLFCIRQKKSALWYVSIYACENRSKAGHTWVQEFQLSFGLVEVFLMWSANYFLSAVPSSLQALLALLALPVCAKLRVLSHFHKLYFPHIVLLWVRLSAQSRAPWQAFF